MDASASMARAASAFLDVVSGPAAGARLPLTGEILFGRDAAGAGTLHGDPWLSPSHATVRRGASGQFELDDLGSIEGTKLNGGAVRGPSRLHFGDVIELGSSRIVVSDEGASGAAPSAPPPPADRLAGSRYRTDAGAAGYGAAPARVTYGTVPAAAAYGAPPAPAGYGTAATAPGYTAASEWRRLLAFVADQIIELGVASAATHFFMSITAERGLNVLWALLSFIVAAELTYRFLLESLTGQTLGKRLFGIRVVRLDGRPLDPNAVVARAVLLLVDGWVVPALISMVLTGRRRRQRIGDLAGGTIVVSASVPHAGFARRDRDRLALAYPLLWCATIAAVLHLAGPGLQSCRDAGIDPPTAREGSCLQVMDGKLIETTIVNSGHTLHLPPYDVTLERTAVEPAPQAADSVVAFELTVKNKTAAPLAFDAGADLTELWVSDPGPSTSPGLGADHLPEAPYAAAGFPSFAAGGPIFSGQRATAWVVFAVPDAELASLTAPRTDLMVAATDGQHAQLGEVRLWRVSGAAGTSALAGLTR